MISEKVRVPLHITCETRQASYLLRSELTQAGYRTVMDGPHSFVTGAPLDAVKAAAEWVDVDYKVT